VPLRVTWIHVQDALQSCGNAVDGAVVKDDAQSSRTTCTWKVSAKNAAEGTYVRLNVSISVGLMVSYSGNDACRPGRHDRRGRELHMGPSGLLIPVAQLQKSS
jgi:hypothetical protein